MGYCGDGGLAPDCKSGTTIRRGFESLYPDYIVNDIMKLTILGKTEDGLFQVVDGTTVFKLYDQTGMPLDIVFMELRDRGYMPAWETFYAAAQGNGWKHKTIVSRLREALGVYNHNKNFTEAVLARLEALEAAN
jgi:hypothetical protein